MTRKRHRASVTYTAGNEVREDARRREYAGRFILTAIIVILICGAIWVVPG